MATQARTSIFYPTHINAYLQCPERYYHERVERRRLDQPFSPALAKGIAIHEILDEATRTHRASSKLYDGPAIPFEFSDRAQRAVPRDRYLSDLEWNADVEYIVAAVKNGLNYLDGSVRILATEATYHFSYKEANSCPPFTLAAKVDLVLHRFDEQGVPLLEVVDYKSGLSVRPDPIQEIAARIVVRQNAHRFDVAYDHIRNTTLHVGAGTVVSQVIEADECGNRWSQIKQVVNAITEGRDWTPNPSPLCEWCPFFNNGCSLAATLSDNQNLGAWLDSIAD